MTPTVEKMVNRLIARMEQERRHAIEQGDSIARNSVENDGKIGEALERHVERWQSNHYLAIHRPEKARVTTMEAAIDHLIANPPANFFDISKGITYQTNGNIDYLLRCRVKFPDINYFTDKAAAIRQAYFAMEARDDYNRIVNNRYDLFDKMRVSCDEAYQAAMEHATMLKSEGEDYRKQRLKVQSLAGQVRRDMNYTTLNSNSVETDTLWESVRNLGSAARAHYLEKNEKIVKSADECGNIIHAARVAVDSYSGAMSSIDNAWKRMNEIMDSVDKFETMVRG